MKIQNEYKVVINYDISNEAELIHTYRVWDQIANQKKLMLYTSSGKFFISEIGSLVGDSPLAKFDTMQDVINFVVNYR